MNFSNWRMVISFVLSLALIVPMPQSAQAATISNSGLTLMTTQQALQEISPIDAKAQVNAFFAKDDVRKMLLEHGVRGDEIDHRLASLSDSEMQSLASHVKEARAGGDILVTVLLVVLIIYFIKRI